jgi:hypothetical protein
MRFAGQNIDIVNLTQAPGVVQSCWGGFSRHLIMTVSSKAGRVTFQDDEDCSQHHTQRPGWDREKPHSVPV